LLPPFCGVATLKDHGPNSGNDNPSEEEVLFELGARFLIVKITKMANDITEIQLRQLDNNGAAPAGPAELLFAEYEEWSAGNGSMLYGVVEMDTEQLYAEPCPDQPGVYDAVQDVGGAYATAPIAAAAVVQRCKKCQMKVQQCMCHVRRNTKNMVRQSKCVQKTSTGACSNPAVGKSARCNDHTCQQADCLVGKSSKVKFCNAHGRAKKSRLLNQKSSTVQNPAFVHPGAGAVAFIPAAYDANDASNSTVTYAVPFERNNDAVYAEAEQGAAALYSVPAEDGTIGVYSPAGVESNA